MPSPPPPLDATDVLLADSLALLNIDGEHDPSTTTTTTIDALRAHCTQLRTAVIEQRTQLATVCGQLVAERTKATCLAEQLVDTETLLQVRCFELTHQRRQCDSLESKLAATNERCIELEANRVADAALVDKNKMIQRGAQRNLGELKRQGDTTVGAARPRRVPSASPKESQQLIKKLRAHRAAAYAKLGRTEREFDEQRRLAVEWERRWQRAKRDAETVECSSAVLEKQLTALKVRLSRMMSHRAVEVEVVGPSPPLPVVIGEETAAAAAAVGEPIMEVVVLPPVAIDTEAAAIDGEPAPQQQQPPIGESELVSSDAIGDGADIANDFVIVYAVRP